MKSDIPEIVPDIDVGDVLESPTVKTASALSSLTCNMIKLSMVSQQFIGFGGNPVYKLQKKVLSTLTDESRANSFTSMLETSSAFYGIEKVFDK